MKRAPTALEAYEKMAEAYAARIDTKAHNAYYERPAMESLLPDVRGRRVLDAGCGPGVYAGWLSKRGADVLGLDVSPRMIALARERKVTKAVFRVADIGQPLDFLGGEEFDVVLSALALDHVEDWSSVFREFFRVLVPSGTWSSLPVTRSRVFC